MYNVEVKILIDWKQRIVTKTKDMLGKEKENEAKMFLRKKNAGIVGVMKLGSGNIIYREEGLIRG